MTKTRGKEKRSRFPCTGFHTRKTTSFLISVIPFFRILHEFFEPADFLLAATDTVDLHTAQDHRGNAAAQKQADNKVQHSFITSPSCGD